MGLFEFGRVFFKNSSNNIWPWLLLLRQTHVLTSAKLLSLSLSVVLFLNFSKANDLLCDLRFGLQFVCL